MRTSIREELAGLLDEVEAQPSTRGLARGTPVAIARSLVTRSLLELPQQVDEPPGRFDRRRRRDR